MPDDSVAAAPPGVSVARDNLIEEFGSHQGCDQGVVGIFQLSS